VRERALAWGLQGGLSDVRNVCSIASHDVRVMDVTVSTRHTGPAATEPSQEQVDTLVAASRVFVALSVQSLAEVDEVVTLVQLRALFLLTSQGPANLSTLAEALGVHASNASRTCEALVSMGLLDRRDDPNDRRNVVLAPRERGRQVVRAVLDRRSDLLAELLGRLSPGDRTALTGPLQRLVEAAGDVPANDIWSVG
jgi:DNA-binding MarR family transcriptional regulator